MKKLLVVLSLGMTALVFQFCSSSKKAAASTISYEKNIAGMMQTSCAPCHFPPDGRKEALNSYDALSKHIDEVIERVKLPQTDPKFMPFKLKKPALTESDIAMLQQWKEQGMPR